MTVLYAYQTNATGECGIRTIVTIGRSMLQHARLDKSFWGEAAMTAVSVKNRLRSPTSATKTPYEMVYGMKPIIKHMKFFGCLALDSGATHHVWKEKANSFQLKTVKVKIWLSQMRPYWHFL